MERQKITKEPAKEMKKQRDGSLHGAIQMADTGPLRVTAFEVLTRNGFHTAYGAG